LSGDIALGYLSATYLIIEIARLIVKKWSLGRDSNPHAVKLWILNPMCLPFHHRALFTSKTGASFNPNLSAATSIALSLN